MRTSLILLALCLIPTGCKSVGRDQLQAKSQAVIALALADGGLAGSFEDPSKELMNSWGGGTLTGSELHLYSDGTYIYAEFACVEPLTIYDKGRWVGAAGAVELHSDPEITWSPQIARRLLAVRRAGRVGEVLLVEKFASLQELERQLAAEEDPNFFLLLNSLARETVPGKRKEQRKKVELLSVAWRPEYFQEQASQ